jgi:hypothetical protein
VRRIATRGTDPFRKPGSTPRTWRKPAFSNIEAVPKNA